jgi:hypothetical protein
MSAALQAFSPETCDILIDWVLVFLAVSALLLFNGKYEAVSNGMWMLGMSVLMSCIPGMDLPLQLADLRELVGMTTGFLG